MKKLELMGIIEELDAKVKKASDEGDRDKWIAAIDARLTAEINLVLVSLVTRVRKLEEIVADGKNDVIDAVVQRTWPGVIKFDDYDEALVSSEEKGSDDRNEK